MQALLTRPAEDAAAPAAALTARGLAVLLDPLLQITMISGPDLELQGCQGLLITSANGIRALAGRTERRDLPVWTVGDASARTARTLGFDRVSAAGGDVDALAALVRQQCQPETGWFLHAAGSVVAGDLGGQLAQAGFAVQKAELYRAMTADALSPAVQAALQAGQIDLTLIYSPRSAKTLVRLIDAAGLTGQCRRIHAFALSAAVADALTGPPWAGLDTAAVPTSEALLAAVDDWMQRSGRPEHGRKGND